MTTPGTPPGAPVERSWGALRLVLPAGIAERLLAEFGSDCIGAESTAAADGCEELTLYFEEHAQAEAAARRLRRLADLGDAGLSVMEVADGHWVERYQATLLPFDIGTGFTVDPVGDATPAGGRKLLRLVPGQAFGTGEHPTTRLCVAAIERSVLPGSRWLDVGCGSGILSVVAAACGASEVLALDNDRLAVEIARQVIEGNGMAHAVRVEEVGEDALPSGRWDGIVVNISTPFLLAGAPALAERLKAGGSLVASGFPSTDAEAVERTLEAAGFEIGRRESLGEWGLAVARSGASR